MEPKNPGIFEFKKIYIFKFSKKNLKSKFWSLSTIDWLKFD